MPNADLMPSQHLARQAVMDIRPSPPPQLWSHPESLRLPDVLDARARQLGWPDDALAILEDDLGLTAATAHHRAGCHPLVAHVPLAHGGLMVSSDVTCLSRHGAAGYPLLDLCGEKGCLSADGDGLEDPATVNGRLRLGVQGPWSAWERHPMPARRTAGLLHQAARGAWAGPRPTGVVRHGQGNGHQMPNQEAPARLALGCETWLPCRSASHVVDVLQRSALWRPRRDRVGDGVWQTPRVAAVLSMRQQPASAGAFPAGRSRTLRREAAQARPSITRLPQAPWRLGIPDVSPASMRWDTSTQMPTLRTDHEAA